MRDQAPQKVNRIADAVDAFLKHYGAIGGDSKYRGMIPFSSWRKYRNSLYTLPRFCDSTSIRDYPHLALKKLTPFEHLGKSSQSRGAKSYRFEGRSGILGGSRLGF